MGSKKVLACFILMLVTLWAIRTEKASGVDLPSAFSEPNIRIVDLTANRFSDQRVLVVSGNIENLGNETIEGHAVIYLKNGTSVINAIDTPVNNGAPIARGGKGYFELTTNIGNLPLLGDITVEFVSKRLLLR